MTQTPTDPRDEECARRAWEQAYPKGPAWDNLHPTARDQYTLCSRLGRLEGSNMPEPVDPFILEAREFVAIVYEAGGAFVLANDVRRGGRDGRADIQAFYRYLKSKAEGSK